MTPAWAMFFGFQVRTDSAMSPGWPAFAGHDNWVLFRPKLSSKNKRENDAQHTRRRPARQRQGGINPLRHEGQVVLHPAFETVQAVLVNQAPDGAQAAHRDRKST